MPITTDIKHFPKPHGQNGGGGGTTVVRNGVNNSDLPTNLSVTSISAIYGHINELSGRSLNYNDGTFIYLAAQDGTISKLRGDEIEDYTKGTIHELWTDNIHNSGKITTDEFEATKAWIENLNSKYITTEYLTVTKQAHFFELIIDKVKSVGGTLMLTQAQAILDYAQALDSNLDPLASLDDANALHYDVFWLAQDKTNGKEIKNEWWVNDQAYCQSFNVKAGTNYNVSNKYYWRLVEYVYPDTGVYVNFSTGAQLPFGATQQEQEQNKLAASSNRVTITNPRVVYTLDSVDTVVNVGWNTTAQTLISGAVQDGNQYEYIFKRFTEAQTFVLNDDNPANWAANQSAEYRGPAGYQWSDDSQGVDVDWPYEYMAVREKTNSTWSKFSTPVLYKRWTGASWTQTSGGASQSTVGVMSTNNTVFGIQLLPIQGTNLAQTTPSKFMLECDRARLNIGIYYQDGTTQFFAAPEVGKGTTHYEYELTTNTPIEAVVITNADELQWHLCHGIRLSNDYANGGCDEMLVGSASIPSAGDNIAQLGYRYNVYQESEPEYDIPRSSAIIIAAYQTPDKGEMIAGDWKDGITPPSYAQYTKITDFHLTRHRDSYVDANGAAFYGNLYTETGDKVEDLINQATGQSYLHIAYATSINGADFAKTPVPGVTYTWIGLRTDTSQSDASLVWADYEHIEISPGSGVNGGSWTYAYANTTDPYNGPTPPAAGTTLANLPSPWTAQPTAISAGQYTWQTTCFVSGATGLYGTWQPAVRLTGENGENGADGNDIEFIYTRNNGRVVGDQRLPDPPDAPVYDNNNQAICGNPGQDDWHGTDSNGIEWTDNPQGVSENMMFEYMCQRIKANGTWGAYYPNPAAVWSNWGVKGQDGDGYEYIFKHFTVEQEFDQSSGNANPANWPAVQQDEYYGPTGYEWDDDPVGVDNTDKYEYVSMRKRTGSDGWGTFSTPALWSRYSSKGSNGGRYVNMYQQIDSDTEPPEFNYGIATSISTMVAIGWSETEPQQINGKYIWMTSAFFDDGQTTAIWGNPIRITGAQGRTGEDGADGKNGNMIEFIYKRFTEPINWAQVTTYANPEQWPTSQVEDYFGPSGYEWTDNPDGVSETYKYEYMAQRQYKTQNSGDTVKRWGGFTRPVLWSNWGVKGQDGDGYEYIFKAFTQEQTWGNNNYNPAYWDAQQQDEYLGPSGYQWTDDPVELSSTNKFEYVSVRKRIGGTWYKFSEPQIWAMYGGIGPTGPQGPDGPTGPQGNNGSDGQDGVSYQIVANGGQGACVQILLDDNANLKLWMMFDLRFKVLRIEGDTMRFMTMGEMRDWTKKFSTYSNQNGCYIYVRMTTGTTANPTYRWYKMKLNTSSSTSSDAEYTLSYQVTVDNQNLESNYITSSNRDLQIRLVEANLSQGTTSWYDINGSSVTYDYFNTDNTTVLNHTLDSYSVSVSSDPKTMSYSVGDKFRRISTRIDGNEAHISSVEQTADHIRTDVETIQGDYVTSSQLEQTADGITSEVNQKLSEIDVKTSVIIECLKDGDQTVFYPVHIPLKRNMTDYQRIKISRYLNQDEFGNGPSSWGNFNGNYAGSSYVVNGFVVCLDWKTIGSGGGTTWNPNDYQYGPTINYDHDYIYDEEENAVHPIYPRYVISYDVAWTKYVASANIPENYVAGNIIQNPHGSRADNTLYWADEIVYLRGGSKYKIETDVAGLEDYIKWCDDNNTYRSAYHWSNSSLSYDAPLLYYYDFHVMDIDQLTNSQIQQTASKISLKVKKGLKETGIDISNGNIDLIADKTNIIGNLNLKNSDNGMTLYDAGGNARVRVTPNELPSVSEFSSRSYINTVSNTITKPLLSDGETINASADINATTSLTLLGTLSGSVTFTIKPSIFGYLASGSSMECNPSSITCSVNLYRNGSSARSTSQTLNRQSTTGGQYEYPSFNWTPSTLSSGTYTIRITITAQDPNGYETYSIFAGIDYTKIVESMTYVGLNGLLVGESQSHYAKIAKDSFELCWVGIPNDIAGGGAIRLSDAGLQRSYDIATANSTVYRWCGLDAYSRVTMITYDSIENNASYIYYGSTRIWCRNYAIQPNDVIIFIDSSANNVTGDIYIGLGDGLGNKSDAYGAMPGRHVMIRNFSTKSVFVCCGQQGYYIMDVSNRDRRFDRYDVGNGTYEFMAIPPYNNCKWMSIRHYD